MAFIIYKQQKFKNNLSNNFDNIKLSYKFIVNLSMRLIMKVEVPLRIKAII